jgi:hypothetical protein
MTSKPDLAARRAFEPAAQMAMAATKYAGISKK